MKTYANELSIVCTVDFMFDYEINSIDYNEKENYIYNINKTFFFYQYSFDQQL